MAEYTQADRPLRIKTPLGPDVLLLERLQGEERISAPFRYVLNLLSEKQDIDPAALLGKAVTIEIDFGGETRHINGIMSRVSQGDRGMRLTRYYAEVVPTIWLTSLVRDNRIFQSKKVPDILTKVLDDQGVQHTLSLSGTYQPRNYCSQYGETNFAFISRLMEEEGIFYFFKHSDGSHSLQIADVSGQVPSLAAAHTKIEVMQGSGAPRLAREPLLMKVEAENAVISGTYRLWDHNFELPGKNLEAEQRIRNGEAALEVFEYPGGYAQRFDGINSGGGEQAAELQKIFDDNMRTAGLRAREAGTPYRTVRGSSNYPLLIAGHKFSIDRHYRGDVNGEYVLTSIQHSASVENYENA
jgi:type VI secretion system secreted protein VgrG